MPRNFIKIFFQKKSIEITSKAPSKSAIESEKNGEPSVKKAKISESLDDSAEGVEQVEEIDDEEED